MARLLLAAMVFVCSHLGQVSVTRVDAPFTLNGVMVEGAAWCQWVDGQPHITYWNTPYTIEHEWLHLAACAADGQDASTTRPASLDPTHCGEVPDDCAHSWVYWALRNPDAAVRVLNNRPPAAGETQ